MVARTTGDVLYALLQFERHPQSKKPEKTKTDKQINKRQNEEAPKEATIKKERKHNRKELNQLTPYPALHEKLIVARPSTKFQHFKDSKGSLPCSEGQPLVSMLNPMNVVYTFPSSFFKINFDVIPPPNLRLPRNH